jgi:hypothetical protein
MAFDNTKLDNEITLFDAFLYAQEGESPSKAIENQEKRGQQMVVEYRRLPKATNHCSGYHKHDDFEFTKAQYEKMGIKVIDEYDDLIDAQISMEYENGKFIFDTETNSIV